MKNILFLVTHLGSDYPIVFNTLGKNPRIQGFQIGRSYSNMGVVELLTSMPHKLKNSAAIYMDVLLFNYLFSFPPLYNMAKFIYLIREARPTLNQIMLENKYPPDRAFKYYSFRLRRICEMVKRTPNSLILTWDSFFQGDGLPMIEEYLDLKDPLKIYNFERVKEVPDVIDPDLVKKAQECYERHFLFLKHQDSVLVY